MSLSRQAATIVLFLACTFLPPREAAASTNVLTNCTVQAVRDALAQGGHIQLDCTATLTLTNTITISRDTLLDGAGGDVILSGGSGTNGVRLFIVNPGVRFELRNLTLANGTVQGSGPDGASPAFGGALFNNGGHVVLANVQLSNHRALGAPGAPGLDGLNGTRGGSGGSAAGGAIYNQGGSLFASNTVFSINLASGGTGGAGGDGGVIGSSGHGADGGNGGTARGGAIFNTGQGQVTIVDGTFHQNSVAASIGGDGGLGQGLLGFDGDNGLPGTAGGAAIYNESGQLTISHSSFATNSASAAPGGHGANGILNRRGQHGTPGGNAAGGGIFNAGGVLQVINSTFFSNQLTGGRGGNGGHGSTTSFGSDGGNGGAGGHANGSGIFNGTGSAVIVNATFATNSAIAGLGGTNGLGGGFTGRAGRMGETGSTHGGSLFNAGGTLTVRNSILAHSTAATELGGSVVDGGFNLLSDASLRIPSASTLRNTDPLLGPFAQQGGRTPTFSLMTNSPAINAITAPSGNGGPLVDQRHATRVEPFDIGAFELGGPLPEMTLHLQPGSNAQEMVLSWPVSRLRPNVESTSSLVPPIVWSSVPTAPSSSNHINQLSVPSTNGLRYFRLQAPASP